MHEIEGLAGVEVAADDFLVVGFGDNREQATRNHDENFASVLEEMWRGRSCTLSRSYIRGRPVYRSSGTWPPVKGSSQTRQKSRQ